MNKEIKYGGYTANPNDREALEGDLAVAMNLVPEHDTIRPVLPPNVIAQIPGDTNLPDKGRKIVCIHQTSAFKHFIVAIEFDGLSPQHPPYTYLYSWDGTEGSSLVHLSYKAFNEVYKVEPVGNTLVVLADDGLHYYLWKNGAYNYLGDHLPELDLRFYTKANNVPLASDQHEVDLGNESTPSGINTNKELCASLHQAIIASANQVSSKVFRRHHFAYPFFIRYAFRLYDGSLTMHSVPSLMIPTFDTPTIIMGWTVTSGGTTHVDGPAKVSATLLEHVLHYHALYSSQVDEVANWSDIISSVDVFISPQFYTYDQAERDDEYTFNQPLKQKDITESIRDNGNFHLIKSIKINDIFLGDGQQSTADGVNRPSEARPRANTTAPNTIEPDFDLNNDNIVVRELMTDDYGTHDLLMASRSFAYNNRINLAGTFRKLFDGFNPACMWSIVRDNQTARTTTATVVIEQGGKEIVVKREPVSVFFDNDNTIVWFFYPNADAKRAYLDINGAKVTFELTQHAMLNGAYYYGLASDAIAPQSVDAVPAPSSGDDAIVNEPNKVYTSEVNNPFNFPVTGINSISSGEIMGICAAVRPVSTGQVGYADLYIFADNGVWTAKINEKGTYSNVTLATGDICINPDSITQMETSVLFTTERGIMLISGSQAQCISDTIDDNGMQGDGMDATVNLLSRLAGLDSFSVDRFATFLQRCRCLYDYSGQRIIVYRPDYNYAYIYSLESNKWGMMQCNIDYSVRAYPATLAVTRDGELVDCSAGDDSAAVNALLVTRPLAFDLPDVHKTVSAVMQRGMFMRGFHLRKLGTLRDGHAAIETVLYGSNDLSNWHTISSSTDENLRGRRGTPFKWFRVALLLRLKHGESVTGCSVTLEPRYTNMLR